MRKINSVSRRCGVLLGCLWGVWAAVGLAEDGPSVFADFEGETYPDGWTATGTAFGTGPARGTLPRQMAVTRFMGRGLVNSFLGGDAATGTLTSPAFTISRSHISLLVGGGACPGKLGVDLVVDGQAVRTATGRNAPDTGVGLGEALTPVDWDVTALKGRRASIRIYDELTCGWGHINVDQICFADAPVEFWSTARRTFAIQSKGLLLPIRNGAPTVKLARAVDAEALPVLDVPLADGDQVDWWAWMDVRAFRGRKLTLSVEDCSSALKSVLDKVRPADAPPPGLSPAADTGRPQFHYTPRLGWVNDPNGLVFRDGTWHFFYQHNPYAIVWGNMHWGHAVSTDLVHWTELGEALEPDASGTMFSGCGVVDRRNTAGFGANALVFLYTAAGSPFTQGLAHSCNGRTLVKYAGNPVLPCRSGSNRDPKVFWHAATKAWVMILYGDEARHHVFWIFRSPDLKKWTHASTLVGDVMSKGNWRFECPGLEQLKIEGESGTAWVVWGAGPWYDVGTFDGHVFRPEAERLVQIQDRSSTYYAAQTYSNAPKGRSVWVAWFQQPADPANTYCHSFSLPFDLSLRRTKEGLRLVRRPAKELEALRTGPAVPLRDFDGELVEAHLACTLPANGRASFDLRGVQIEYDAPSAKLAIAGRVVDWPVAEGRLALRVYLDRTSVEVVSQDGLLLQPVPVRPDPKNRRLSATFSEGVRDVSCTAYPLRSIWN